MNRKYGFLASVILCPSLLFATTGWADDDDRVSVYEITVTNLTPGQPLAPIFVTSHKEGLSFFEAGGTPTPELAALAEAGNGHPMAELVLATPGYRAAEVGSGPTLPGHSATVTVNAKKSDRISLGAMLGNTNDAFVALVDMRLPRGTRAVTYMAAAYDAGTETNDESCSTVPGPACGGAALSPEDSGEGIVTIHNGIHGVGGLIPSLHDWQNPVAKVVIKRK